MLGGQDADGLLVGLQGGVPDLLQLHVDLVHSQRGAITVVHVQDEELSGGKRQGERQRERQIETERETERERRTTV